MDSSTKDMKVTIHLSDVDCNEQFPDRILSLSHPDFCVTVGRGSQSDENIEPAPDNAWFSSRVMSRQHALLRADPYDQILTIQDDASMHGTFLNGDRVGKERVDLISGDILTFGTEVVRGEDTYQPLKVSIHYDWEEEVQEKELVTETGKDTSASTTTSFRNKFTVDFSEEDPDSDFDDDDIQILSESAREPSVEILCQVDAPKTQPHRPANLNLRPLPVSALMTTTSTSDETTMNKASLTSEQSKASPTEEGDDSDAENDPEPFPSQYYTDDEDESDVDSDMFNDESDFADEVGKEDGRDVETIKVGPIPQPAPISCSRPVPTNCVPTVLSDNTEREPSPSDAALARPRLAAPTVPPASKPTSINSVPQPSATHTLGLEPSYGTSSFDKYDHNRMYYPSFNVQETPVSRPSHSFVNPYSYNSLGSPICSVGGMNSYPSGTSTYPWDLWKSVPLPYANAQQPRPITRFGPPTCSSSTSAFPNPPVVNIADQLSPSTTSSLSPDNLRGKKRKADEVSEFSDDESVDSTPDTTPTKSVSFERSSPAPSKATGSLHISSKVIEASDAERDSSLEVEEALEQADVFVKELQARVDQAQNEIVNEHRFYIEQQEKEANHTEKLTESDAQAQCGDEGRLRKKRKISPEEGSPRRSLVSTALKYTATALAGATVGVLGTVVGLASLPTDYFV